MQRLHNCKNLTELKLLLEKQGIETLYKYKGQTTELQGISFKIGEFRYKGDTIDRNFSLKNLQRTINEQQPEIRIEKAEIFNTGANFHVSGH